MLREIAARCRRDNVCLQQLAVAAVTAAVLLAVAAASAAAQGLPNLAALQTRGASISALVDSVIIGGEKVARKRRTTSS